MKKITFLILIFIVSLTLSAQINKDLFMIEGGIYLGGNNDYWSAHCIGTTGISFRSEDYFTKNLSDGVTRIYQTQNKFSFSIAPRIGYMIFKNFVVGVDLQYHKNIYKWLDQDHTTDKYRSGLYGIFIRQYFGNWKFVPLVEAGLGFGLSKSLENSSSSGGGQYQIIKSNNLFYLTGSAGISYLLSSKFRINLLAKAQQTNENLINTGNFSYSTSKILYFDTALVLSFSYFFNKKNHKELKIINQN